MLANGVRVQRMLPGGETETDAHRCAAAGNARIERVLDRFAHECISEILGFEEFIVDRIDVHFAAIHGAEMPGGEPGHEAIVGSVVAADRRFLADSCRHQTGDYPLTPTRIPPLGRSVIDACASTERDRSVIRHRCARVASIRTPSIQAKPSPMQMRGPAPKGK